MIRFDGVTVMKCKWGKALLAGVCIVWMFLCIPISANATGKDVVYTSMTKSITDKSGDGTKENPYNRFEDAVANVADGGTIYVLSSKYALINDQGNDEPFVIDKAVVIEPEPGASRAILVSRAAGIILGANVTFNNIELDFANRYHDQVYANGYKLVLNNVSRSSSYGLIDIVAGGLYDTNGNKKGPTSGRNGQILIQGKSSEFGNLYAGSINGVFDGNASISIQDARGATIGDIYASGAKEAEFNRNNWFDMTEPPAPAPDPDKYTVTGKAEIAIRNAPSSIKIIEGDGALRGTAVFFSSPYRASDLSLLNLMRLTVEKGTLEPAELNAPAGKKMDIVLEKDGILDLSGLGEIEVDNFAGGGKLVLNRNAVMKIAGDVTGKTIFGTDYLASANYSGMVEENHVYIEAGPETHGIFTFEPYPAQDDFKLAKQSDGSWKTIKSTKVAIMYWTEKPDRGDVTTNWEMFDPETENPGGAVAEGKPGYHFVNWTDENGNEVGTKELFVPQKTDGEYIDAVYMANFEPNTYKVVFDANGGTEGVMKEQIFIYGQKQALSKCAFVMDGYDFKGWNTKKDNSGTVFADLQEVINLTVEKDGQIVLYAQWTKKPEETPGGNPDRLDEDANDPDVNLIDIENNPVVVSKVADLKADEITYNTVSLTWTMQQEASGYIIYRSTSKLKDYKKIATVTTNTYSDKKLITGKTYYYKVSAYNDSMEGESSDIISVKPVPAKPVIELKTGKKYVTIKCKKVNGADGYEIYRSTKKKNGYKRVIITKKNIYKNKGLESKKTYYYKVRAYKKVKGKKVYSAYSKVKSVKVK